MLVVYTCAYYIHSLFTHTHTHTHTHICLHQAAVCQQNAIADKQCLHRIFFMNEKTRGLQNVT
jgi:hypothetical protein